MSQKKNKAKDKRQSNPNRSKGIKFIVAGLVLIGAAFSANLYLDNQVSDATVSPSSEQSAERFQEGKHYDVLSNPSAVEIPQVTEFFWYGCPHCFKLEPAVQHWLDDKPRFIDFERVHVAFAPTWQGHAKVYYALRILGIADEVHEPVMKAIQSDRAKYANPHHMGELIEQLMPSVEKERFVQTFDSQLVEAQVEKANKLASQYGLRGVPAIVVNGRYLTSPVHTGGGEETFDVVDFLIQKDRKENAAAKQSQQSQSKEVDRNNGSTSPD